MGRKPLPDSLKRKRRVYYLTDEEAARVAEFLSKGGSGVQKVDAPVVPASEPAKVRPPGISPAQWARMNERHTR